MLSTRLRIVVRYKRPHIVSEHPLSYSLETVTTLFRLYGFYKSYVMDYVHIFHEPSKCENYAYRVLSIFRKGSVNEAPRQ